MSGDFGGGYSESSYKSWGQRIAEAFVGVIVGGILFLVSFPLLFWNEGNAVKTAQALTQGAKDVLSVPADKVEAGNDGKEVHVSGLATTDETLTDAQFGVSDKALKLQRVVRMYQYVERSKSEKRKKLGGGEETVTTYTYEKEWSDKLNDSSSFHAPDHPTNPASKRFEDRTETAKKVTLGAFVLPESLVSKIDKTETLPMTKASLDNLSSDLKDDKFKVESGQFYLGKDPAAPDIGDLKIEFKVIKPTEVSIIAQQTGGTFQPYQPKGHDRAINLLNIGKVGADQMFEQAQAANSLMTWILRLVGFLLMAGGIFLVLRPFVVLLDVLPILGDFASIGVAIFAGLVALPLSLIVIAIGWVFYRPLLGISILVVAVAILVGVVMMIRKARQKAVLADVKGR